MTSMCNCIREMTFGRAMIAHTNYLALSETTWYTLCKSTIFNDYCMLCTILNKYRSSRLSSCEDVFMSGQQITCKTSRKQLASIDNDALYLWCKRCNTEHAISKQELLQIWGNTEKQEADVDVHP